MKRSIYEFKAEALAKLKVLKNALEDCGIDCHFEETESKSLWLAFNVPSELNGSPTQVNVFADRDCDYELEFGAESTVERKIFQEMLDEMGKGA